MILRVFRALEFLRILREERDRYRDFARGGALGDSDTSWPSVANAPPGPSDLKLHERGGSVLPERPPMEPKR